MNNSNNLAERTNAYSPWNPSPANNYVHTYNPPQQQTQVQTTVFSIGKHTYSLPSNMIFTSTVSKKEKK